MQNPLPKNNTRSIADALETAEGRKALSQAMVDPIKITLNYQGIGRKLLNVNFGSVISSIKRVVDPIIEIDDWISPDYWPEWEVEYENGTKKILSAPCKEDAIRRALEEFMS